MHGHGGTYIKGSEIGMKFQAQTLSFLAFLQKLFMVAFEMLSGSLPSFFSIFLTSFSMTRKSASALA